MQSVMKHNFSQVPQANIPRSSFNRSHGYKTCFGTSNLIPFYVDEALPGDTFNLNATLFARLATPTVPIMDNLYMDVFFFSVPIRLVWDNFQKFMGEKHDPADDNDYLVPTMTAAAGGFGVNSLADYFGIVPDITGIEVDSLWHRAYNLIWNEWFRDQNLHDAVTVDTDDGPDDPADYVLKRRCKKHDYFTSCLPWPIKGPGVEIPLGTEIPVRGIGTSNQTYIAGNAAVYESQGAASITYNPYKKIQSDGSDADSLWRVQEDPNNSGYPWIYADLQGVNGSSINSLRQAFQLQKLLERDARGGSRYTEILRSHFGVVSPDARLQRPEYLGGGTAPVSINAVAQTSETAATPQGTLAGIGTTTLSGKGFTKSFVEHTLLMGILSVRGDVTYQAGIPRMFSRQTRFDFYWPSFAHLGEQAVLNKEIYADNSANDDLVFGYQERYAEYRYYPSKVTGKLRSNYATTLHYWHLSEDFANLPTLGSTFIEDSTPVDRIIEVPSGPHWILDSYIQCNTVRPMPVYSVPGLTDHF